MIGEPHILTVVAIAVLFFSPCIVLPAGTLRVQWQAVLFQWAGVLTVATVDPLRRGWRIVKTPKKPSAR